MSAKWFGILLDEKGSLLLQSRESTRKDGIQIYPSASIYFSNERILNELYMIVGGGYRSANYIIFKHKIAIKAINIALPYLQKLQYRASLIIEYNDLKDIHIGYTPRMIDIFEEMQRYSRGDGASVESIQRLRDKTRIQKIVTTEDFISSLPQDWFSPIDIKVDLSRGRITLKLRQLLKQGILIKRGTTLKRWKRADV